MSALAWCSTMLLARARILVCMYTYIYMFIYIYIHMYEDCMRMRICRVCLRICKVYAYLWGVCVFVRCMRICEAYACLQCSCVFAEAQAYVQSESVLAECKCVCGVCVCVRIWRLYVYLQGLWMFAGVFVFAGCMHICRVYAYLESL